MNKDYAHSMQDDLISRQDAIEALIQEFYSNVDDYISEKQAVHAIDSLPSAQSERKKGKWILECDAEGEGDNLYRCPECGCNYSCQEYDIPNFCPNCGSYNGGENHDKG